MSPVALDDTVNLLENMTWAEATGYLAAVLVFCTFYMKTMIPLRIVGIFSNVTFITYGIIGSLYPVLVLHLILLPLNCLRLLQMHTLIKRVREASRGDLSMEWLTPHMTRRKLKKGAFLFQKGDPATGMYLALRGSIRLLDVDQTIGPGTIIGEIGIFSPYKERTATAVCESDVEIGSIDEATVLQLYFQNPQFGIYLTQLIIRRLLHNLSNPEDPTLPKRPRV
jgi:CRP/FNR family transcriptional regulator, cyclic AMP receptor protein